MKLSRVQIRNFRSCRDVTLVINDLHALVGANNSGKSTVLRALDFLFNPSTKNLNEESFWNKDTSLDIRVEAMFTDLSENEKYKMKGYLRPDGSFHMARTAIMESTNSNEQSDAEYSENKIIIGQQYNIPIPEVEWLNESNINGDNVTEWWKDKDKLIINGKQFLSDDSTKPKVGEWRDKAVRFVEENIDDIPMVDRWIDNPKGYAGVLKGTLPFYILVPAVRDVSEEAKGAKSSPFGKLLYAIIDAVTFEQKDKIDQMLSEIGRQLNRIGGTDRVTLISDTEVALNTLLKDFFLNADLEIEFSTPTLEDLIGSPKLFVDDGFRSAIENKGHGLQRAVIFTILRRYAEYMTGLVGDGKRSMILAVEEPELYMHPQAQRTIRKAFMRISQDMDQVIFSTHSALLVDVACFDEIIRMESKIEMVDGEKKTSSLAWQLTMPLMIMDLTNRNPNLKGKVTDESMRGRYSHVYNPRRNEGFFASKVILVEGLTEEYSLSVYAEIVQGCSFDESNISVVECGGKMNIDRLYRIFNELHIPCYLLFDYDEGNADSEIVNRSRELLKMLGKPIDAPTDVLIDDTVACFRTKFEDTMRFEIPEYSVLVENARKELGIKSDTGKPLIALHMARALTSTDQSTIPPTLRKIIESAANVKWKESCLAI